MLIHKESITIVQVHNTLCNFTRRKKTSSIKIYGVWLNVLKNHDNDGNKNDKCLKWWSRTNQIGDLVRSLASTNWEKVYYLTIVDSYQNLTEEICLCEKLKCIISMTCVCSLINSLVLIIVQVYEGLAGSTWKVYSDYVLIHKYFDYVLILIYTWISYICYIYWFINNIVKPTAAIAWGCEFISCRVALLWPE